jgi:hypothetical protein
MQWKWRNCGMAVHVTGWRQLNLICFWRRMSIGYERLLDFSRRRRDVTLRRVIYIDSNHTIIHQYGRCRRLVCSKQPHE